MADFPESLDIAINNLISTLVYKIFTRENDNDDLEEFIQLTGIPSATDVNIQNYAREKAEEIWGPYKELPLPSSFDGAIQTLASAHQRLTSTGVTTLKDAETFSIGGVVPQYMEAFRINQAGWRGDTIDAVRSGYLDRWGAMVFLQSNTIGMLLLVLQAYQEQIKQAQIDVVNLVNVAEQAIAAYDPSSLCGNSDQKNVSFNIAIGVLSVLSAGAGLAAGAAMKVTTMVAAVAAAGRGVAKDKYEPDKPPDTLGIGGDTVAELWQSILDATEELRKQFWSSETELRAMIDSFHDKVTSGQITVGTAGEGGAVHMSGLQLFRSKKLGVGTASVQRPYIGADNPDPAHSQDR
jgi:hypothetical protein